MRIFTATTEGPNRLQLRELRQWACVVPAAVISSVLTRAAAGGVSMIAAGLFGTAAESLFVYWVQFAMFYAPSKAAFVVGGALTAPRNRVITAVTLAAVASGVSLLVHVLGQKTVGFVNYSHFAAETAGALCGAIFTSILAKGNYIQAGRAAGA